MKRLLVTSGTLLLALTSCGTSAETSPSKPNVLLLTLDTLRVDRLGCYVDEVDGTPNLDELASRGVVFEQAYTPSPMTLPAHSTLMTGLLPPAHAARVNGLHKLSDDVPTLAEALLAEGYRTGAFVAAYVLNEHFGLGRGFDVYDDDLTNAYEQEVSEQLSAYRSGDQVVDAALSWLGEVEGDEPFFAWVHLYDAHFPWHAHGADEVGTYEGEVSFVDDQVGRVLAYLRESGLEENTIVIAVADHGEGLGDHHEIEHAYLLNEEVLHVPLIVAGPGVKQGSRVPALVSLEDVQPTVLTLLGLENSGVDGRSLARALRGEEIPSGESYAETDLPWTAFRWAPQRSLTTEQWKYVRTPQPELYDRTSDLQEYANLALARADVVERMEQRLSAMEAALGERESKASGVGEEELDQLAALGYAAGTDSERPAGLLGLADVKERLFAKDLATELRLALARDAVAPEQHVEVATRLTAMSPETPSFHAELGDAYTRLDDFARALSAYGRCVELAPTDAGAHYVYGDALQQGGRQVEAHQHLELALELDPNLAAAHVGLGNVWRAEGRPDLAAGAYHQALILLPEYAEAHYNLALTFLDRGLAAKAIESFGQALAHKPGWGFAHRQLANLLLASDRIEASLAHFEGALAALPRDPDLRNDFGVALQHMGRSEEAREQYEAASQLRPDLFRPHLNLASLASEQGDDPRALEHCEQALRLAPDHPETRLFLARFQARMEPSSSSPSAQ